MEIKQPIGKLKSGLIEVSLWENQFQSDKGTFTSYTFNLKKSYQDSKDKSWKHQTVMLDSKDLQRAIVLLTEMQKNFLLTSKKEESVESEEPEQEDDLF